MFTSDHVLCESAIALSWLSLARVPQDLAEHGQRPQLMRMTRVNSIVTRLAGRADLTLGLGESPGKESTADDQPFRVELAQLRDHALPTRVRLGQRLKVLLETNARERRPPSKHGVLPVWAPRRPKSHAPDPSRHCAGAASQRVAPREHVARRPPHRSRAGPRSCAEPPQTRLAPTELLGKFHGSECAGSRAATVGSRARSAGTLAGQR